MKQGTRILHLRASNFVGGPEQQLLRYAELEGTGPFQIVLGTFVGPLEGSAFLRAARERGLGALPLPARDLGFNAGLVSLVRTLREQEIALLCTHGYKADILGILAGRLSGKPVACFLRGWTGEDWKVRLYEAADRFLLSWADRIVCLSEMQAGRVSRVRRLSSKVRVVPNAVDVPTLTPEERERASQELRRQFNLPADCPIIATAGRLSPEKGIADFLEAAAMVRSEFPRVCFVVFGDGTLRSELEQRSVQLGLGDSVRFVGFIRQLRQLLPGVNLLVNPSHSEEMPNIVLEAMAASVPVIATAVGGVAEIAGSGETMRLVPPSEPAALARSVSDLLRDPHAADKLARTGHQRVEASFSLERQKSQFHALYEELLQTRPERPVPQEPDFRSAEVTPQVSPVQPVMRGELPLISVVIPVRNEEVHLEAVLSGLAAQEYPSDKFEILVADGNSTDRTQEVIERFAQCSPVCVRRLENPSQRSSAGRNVGVCNAGGELIVFIDGHCQIPSRTLLLDTARLFETTGADCLCRPQPLSSPGNSWFQDAVARVRASTLGHGRDSTVYTSDLEAFVEPMSSGASYRRSVFEAVGYYDEDFDACEDVEFNYRVHRAGLRSFISPRLTVLYAPRNSVRGLWRQLTRYGRGRFRFVQKHPEAFSISQIVPASLLLWILLAGVVWSGSAEVAHWMLVPVAAYLAVLFLLSVRLGWRFGWLQGLVSPVLFLTIHLGLGAGFLREALKTCAARLGVRRRQADSALQQSGRPELGALLGPGREHGNGLSPRR